MLALQRLWQKETRVVAGLMSGTSLDGIDAVVARLSGHGRDLRIEQLGFVSEPFPPALRELILRNSAAATSSVVDLSQLNVRLAHAYADAVRAALERSGLDVSALDLVGSHGQTVQHVPAPADCAGLAVTSTLQIGDPSVLANLLGVPVVGDFRPADMALGGQGAPLVPYFDYVVFADAHETRGLVNIGGIGNITVLPAGGGPTDLYAFDTGPGNMVVDALVRRFFGLPYDAEGQLAAQGRVMQSLLADLLHDPYFSLPPPKSTGREHFGAAFVERLGSGADPSVPNPTPHDFVATATALTAYSIYQAYLRFVRTRHPLDVLIVSGGGMHNRALMDLLGSAFAPIPVRTADDFGVNPDAKEALCFAVLAHETIDGVPTNLPAVTGAARPTLLGKLCVPA